MASAPYPVTFDVEYPDRDLNRLTTFFRLILLIPILIVFGTISGGGAWGGGDGAARAGVAMAGGVLILGPALMILFREKYPRWWFDWNLEFVRFAYRILIYFSLMDDRYPSTDEKQSVTFEMPYPAKPGDVNRWLVLVKWFLVIPHIIILILLGIITRLILILAWFAILFTGRYPRVMFDFLVGYYRWGARVGAYAFLMTTDEYPPFRLGA